ncbi:MAG: acetoacetate--CoA ligase family protein, partial [Mesorhizobium sp.]
RNPAWRPVRRSAPASSPSASRRRSRPACRRCRAPCPHSDSAADCISFGDFGGDGPLVFERVPFDRPAYVLYTSGTTGAPKAIVHRTGGVLLQHLKEHLLHGDVRPGDVMSWYTNTAWMMYHWLISGLACGASVVLYDGSPILKSADG